MSSSINSEILKKIKKLFNLEEGARAIGSLHEAEVAAQKIQELLLLYNINQSEINKLSEEDNSIIRKDLMVEDYTSRIEGKWFRLLMKVIAMHNLCDVVFTSVKGFDNLSRLALIGKKINVDTVEYVGLQLSQRLKEIEKRFWRGYSGSEKRNAFRRGFLMGAVYGINSKLKTQTENFKMNNPNINALILYNDEAIKKFLNNEFPNSREAKATPKYSAESALNMGYKVGKNMDIHKGLDNAKVSVNQLN